MEISTQSASTAAIIVRLNHKIGGCMGSERSSICIKNKDYDAILGEKLRRFHGFVQI